VGYDDLGFIGKATRPTLMEPGVGPDDGLGAFRMGVFAILHHQTGSREDGD
jgi:hypothetical protein